MNKCMDVCIGWKVQGAGGWIRWIKGRMNKWMYVCLGWQVQGSGGWIR